MITTQNIRSRLIFSLEEKKDLIIKSIQTEMETQEWQTVRLIEQEGLNPEFTLKDLLHVLKHQNLEVPWPAHELFSLKDVIIRVQQIYLVEKYFLKALRQLISASEAEWLLIHERINRGFHEILYHRTKCSCENCRLLLQKNVVQAESMERRIEK